MNQKARIFTTWFFGLALLAIFSTEKWFPEYTKIIVGITLIFKGCLDTFCIANKNWGKTDRISFCGTCSSFGTSQYRPYLFGSLGMIFVGTGLAVSNVTFIYIGGISLLIFAPFFLKRFVSKG